MLGVVLFDLGLISHGTEIKSIHKVGKLSQTPICDIVIDWRAKQKDEMNVWG